MKNLFRFLVIVVITIITTCSCASSHVCTGVVSKSVINKYKPVKNNFVKAKYHLN